MDWVVGLVFSVPFSSSVYVNVLWYKLTISLPFYEKN